MQLLSLAQLKLQFAFPTILTRSGAEVGKTNATANSLETAHRHVHHARSCFLVVVLSSALLAREVSSNTVHHARSCFLVVCVVVGSSRQRSLF
ncbi:hypothetical protein C4D60_Mb03t20680 [Musa balbisiana]|uniref:Uncharacterized protein n=1 Tax=Musa balbisiana TaxID=52838 RepID=A0A4S8JBG4_MUSBA|nr:hypothetical protein C4D60_Mb03t20680 [Musa balbisiana]